METTIRKNNGQITPIVHLKVPILYSLLFTSFSRVDGTKELDFSEEKDLFIKLCFFIDTIHRCDTTDVNYAIIFKSNNLNYRSYTSQDYLDIFNYFSREISDVFNMNENILVKSVLSLTSMIPCSCMGTISIEDFRKIENYFHANLSQFIVDSGVFFNSLHNDDVYINNLEQLMLGKIGISVDDLIYIPNSNFMLSNIFDVLFKNKNLGHKFEALIDNEIKKLHYFDKCFCRYYLNKNSQNEHDLLYINTQNKDCLIVECKSSKKHVIFASEEKGHNRLKQEYVEVIKKDLTSVTMLRTKC